MDLYLGNCIPQHSGSYVYLVLIKLDLPSFLAVTLALPLSWLWMEANGRQLRSMCFQSTSNKFASQLGLLLINLIIISLCNNALDGFTMTRRMGNLCRAR